MSAGGFMLAATKNDVLIVQAGPMSAPIFARMRGRGPTHRMSKYLALLALPAPLKKLSAIFKVCARRCDGAAIGSLESKADEAEG